MSIKDGVALTSFGGEREPLLKLSSGGGMAQGSHTCNNFAGRMWSGGAREHYASEISDRKLP